MTANGRIQALAIIIGAITAVSGTVHTANPFIGVLTAPSENGPGDWVPASYVSWLESAGARLIPIPSGVYWDKSQPNWVTKPSNTWSPAQYEETFNQINGLLLPGGDPWPMVSSAGAAQMIELAMKANKAGDHFPIWGTCAGYVSFPYFITINIILQ